MLWWKRWEELLWVFRPYWQLPTYIWTQYFYIVFCRTGAFWCSNGTCIPSSRRCDGTVDCIDDSDETGCGSKLLKKLEDGNTCHGFKNWYAWRSNYSAIIRASLSELHTSGSRLELCGLRLQGIPLGLFKELEPSWHPGRLIRYRWHGLLFVWWDDWWLLALMTPTFSNFLGNYSHIPGWVSVLVFQTLMRVTGQFTIPPKAKCCLLMHYTGKQKGFSCDRQYNVHWCCQAAITERQQKRTTVERGIDFQWGEIWPEVGVGTLSQEYGIVHIFGYLYYLPSIYCI